MTGSQTGGPPKKHPHAATRVYEGEAFVVLSEKSEYKILNGVGSRVWELIDGEKSEADIARIIADEYEVSVDEALSDVKEFVGELREHGMLDDAQTGKVA